MSGYNTKNYREPGGDKTFIGGTLEFGEGAEVENFPLQALRVSTLADDASSADTIDKINEILTALENAGLMAGEAEE